jgi:hypothetical protein
MNDSCHLIDHRDENKRLMRQLAWRLELGTPKDLPIIFHQIPIITPSLVPKWMNEAHADNAKLEHTDRGDDRHNFTHWLLSKMRIIWTLAGSSPTHLKLQMLMCSLFRASPCPMIGQQEHT